MKILKAVAIILSVVAVLFTCVAIFVSFANPEIFKKDIPLKAAPIQSPAASSAAKQTQNKPEDSPSPSPTTSQTNPPPAVTVQPTPDPVTKEDTSTLILGRWIAFTEEKTHMFEFFQDGTFSVGSYYAERDYINFTGTYSFSSSSRLKLKYEESTIEMPSPSYKSTTPFSVNKVLDITIDKGKLIIPQGKKDYGHTEWIKAD